MHDVKTHIKYNKSNINKSLEIIVSDLLKKIYKGNNKPIIIAIGGPGGTGKSTFSEKLSLYLENSNILHLDHYKTSRQSRAKSKIYGAHPKANKIDLILKHLKCIKKNKIFKTPIYDNIKGKANKTIKYNPKRFNILDGEISTYSNFHSYIDFLIFIDSNWKTQLNTRISRDIDIRGYSQEKAIATFLQSNLKEFTKYGASSKVYSDIHLYCKNDYSLIIESINDKYYKDFLSIEKLNISKVDLSGLIVSLPTPFDSSSEIDKEAFLRHLEFLEKNNVKKILVNGIFGECFSLNRNERKLLLKLARNFFPGVVIYHVGANCLKNAISEVKWGEDLGADAIICSFQNNNYFSFKSIDLIEYFNKIKNKISIPFIILNPLVNNKYLFSFNDFKKINPYGVIQSKFDVSFNNKNFKLYSYNNSNIEKFYKNGGYGVISSIASHSLNETLIHNKKIYNKLKINFFNYDWIFQNKLMISKKIKNYLPNVRLPLKNIF